MSNDKELPNLRAVTRHYEIRLKLEVPAEVPPETILKMARELLDSHDYFTVVQTIDLDKATR